LETAAGRPMTARSVTWINAHNNRLGWPPSSVAADPIGAAAAGCILHAQHQPAAATALAAAPAAPAVVVVQPAPVQPAAPGPAPPIQPPAAAPLPALHGSTLRTFIVCSAAVMCVGLVSQTAFGVFAPAGRTTKLEPTREGCSSFDEFRKLNLLGCFASSMSNAEGARVVPAAPPQRLCFAPNAATLFRGYRGEDFYIDLAEARAADAVAAGQAKAAKCAWSRSAVDPCFNLHADGGQRDLDLSRFEAFLFCRGQREFG